MKSLTKLLVPFTLRDFSSIVQRDLTTIYIKVEEGREQEEFFMRIVRGVKKAKKAQRAYIARRTTQDLIYDTEWLAARADEQSRGMLRQRGL